MLAKKAQFKILQSIARPQAESMYYTIIISKNSFYFVKLIINNKRNQNSYVPVVYTYLKSNVYSNQSIQLKLTLRKHASCASVMKHCTLNISYIFTITQRQIKTS